MSFRRALIEICKEPEFAHVAGQLAGQLPVERFHEKHMVRGRVDLDRETLIIGRHPAMRAALRQLGIPLPNPIDYPEPLRHALRRTVRKARLRDVLGDVRATEREWFVKPVDRAKRFTGKVIGPRDFGVSGTARTVWRSDVVRWRSEWRVFVTDQRRVGYRRYIGVDEEPDLDEVDRWIAAWRGPAGYAMDVGVLDDGRTALVECNDGMALGAYGLDMAAYTALLAARWAELVE